MPPAVAAEGLRKEYGEVVALRDVSVEIETGELVAILGPNGAGKSTFIKIVCGVTRPTSGRIEVLGGDPADPETKRRVGIVPQQGGMYPEQTVRENLLFYSKLYGREPNLEPLEMLDVDRFMDRKVGQLSGGMRKRAAIAITLALEPEMLVLDEPTNELDPMARKDVIRVTREFHRRGVTILYVSHEVYEVEQLKPDRVLIFLEGRKELDEPFDRVMERHGSLLEAYEGVASCPGE
ncbi:ABC transporter ATP-binding protein [Methanopyrus sp. SNP6]|uniref:ABC transporter ATP-binding protein n=1 Tax=Methanopyrus sp. SNP6 TaxID=1937005 RepID=UPI001438DD3F|nr:ABC transporter ATP-binding protein [Methanopyrus sp. SNP6]